MSWCTATSDFAALDGVQPATDDDWEREYLSLDMAARVVADVDEAIAHIRRWSSGHTEAIVTRDLDTARRFVARVDSAAVMVNASTRFTDGGEFGFGAEIGISTQKMHARGPMGLSELTVHEVDRDRRRARALIDVPVARFEAMVSEALDGLPPALGRVMRNVAVTVDEDGGDGSLLGLYVGVPLTHRTHQYSGVLPDRITIFRKAILGICDTEERGRRRGPPDRRARGRPPLRHRRRAAARARLVVATARTARGQLWGRPPSSRSARAVSSSAG